MAPQKHISIVRTNLREMLHIRLHLESLDDTDDSVFVAFVGC